MSNNLKQVAKQLNKIYYPEQEKLFPFDLTFYVYPEKEDLLLEVRRRWRIDLTKENKNTIFAKKFIAAIFSGKPIRAEVTIGCRDEFQTKLKLKQKGLL